MIDFKKYLPETNKYIKHYYLLVNKRLETPPKENFHQHHILPRSMFEQFERSENNIVKLTYREHFIAHMLLWMGTKNRYMLWAAKLLTKDFTVNSKTYQFLLEQHNLCEAPNQNRRSIIKNGVMRYVHTDEVREYLKTGWKGGNHLSGRISMHNPSTEEQIYAKENQKEKLLKDGWKLGNLRIKGRVRINNGSDHKLVREFELENYLNDGWVLGYANEFKFMENNGVVTRVCLDEIAEFELEGWKNYKSTLGKIVVVRGEESKCIDPENESLYLNDGWVRGNALSNMKTVYKGDEIIFVSPEEYDSYIKDGWVSYSPSRNKTPILKGEETKFISESEFEYYSKQGWARGNKSSGKLNIIKNGKNKQIDPSELESYLSEGWKRGNSSVGTVTIFKDEKYIQIPKDELDKYVADGWVKRTPSAGRKYINNGIENKQALAEEYETYKANGWVDGFIRKQKKQVVTEVIETAMESNGLNSTFNLFSL